MNLVISSVKDAGDLNRERLVLRATENLNVGDFAVLCCSHINENEVGSGDIPHTYWFENAEVSKDDFVVLYTKRGTRSSKTADTGRTSHFFYWDRTGSIWNANYRPVVLAAPQYQFGPIIA